MSIVWTCLLDIRDGTFDFFDEVYLFGSSLEKNDPEDIDLLLVYKGGQDLSEVATAKQNVVDALCLMWEGKLIDVTTLSKAELAQTGFLGRIQYKPIKDCPTPSGPSMKPIPSSALPICPTDAPYHRD